MRARQGKKTEFRLGGQLITEERLERAKRRHRREEKGLSHPINDHDMGMYLLYSVSSTLFVNKILSKLPPTNHEWI